MTTQDFAADYILRGGVHTVDGWLGGGAITATIALNNWQKRYGVTGNVAEIGIHHGKFFLVLKNLCRPDETAIAIDVFENQELNTDNSGRGDRSVFQSNLAKYSDGANVEIIQSDSTLVTPDRLIAAGKGRPVRIFSVDGSHTTEHTLSDLMLASDVLAARGVIILDDFFNQDWPGVQEGFHHFMTRRRRELAPLAIGDNKLFLCRSSDHDALSQVFRHQLAPYYLRSKNVTLWGVETLSMSLQPQEDVYSLDFATARNVFPLYADKLSKDCALQSGWGRPEDNATWTVGERATIELHLADPPQTGQATLQFEMTPFLHKARASRNIDVYVNGSFAGSKRLTGSKMENVDFTIKAATLREKTSVTIDIESPEQPSKLGMSPDGRALGVKVRSIRLL